MFQSQGFQPNGFQGASAGADGGGFDPTTVVPVNYDGLTTPKAKSARRWPGLLMAGFVLVTTAFDPTLVVPAVAQQALQGYKAPARTVRQTEPQTGWAYTATQPPVDVWDASKFQNNTGDRTPTRQALKFRYPLASSGFSTDGSTPPAGDTWDASKFQSPVYDRMASKPTWSVVRTWAKTSFALLDARPIYPAIAQLASSERMGQPWRWVEDTSPTTPLYTALPVADVWSAEKTPYVSFDRMADRQVVRMQVGLDALGWLYPALPVGDTWSVEKTPYSLDKRLRERFHPAARLGSDPDLGWLYTSLPIPDAWSAEKFQNNLGDLTPRASRLSFRYPLLTTGFSTDGSSPAPGDVWDASKFQAALCDRMGERRERPLVLDYHKFPFGLLDARAVYPALEQLSDSYRAPKGSHVWPQLDQPSQAWITAAVPPFDPRLFIHVEAPDRMADRHLLDLWAYEYFYHLAWLHDVIPLTDTELRLYHKRPIAPIVNRKRRRRC